MSSSQKSSGLLARSEQRLARIVPIASLEHGVWKTLHANFRPTEEISSHEANPEEVLLVFVVLRA